jgi:hypothetical protein
MRDLERDLRELSRVIAVPEAPDVSGRVRDGLPATRPPARGRRRLALALALAIAVGVVVGLAVSPARTSILRFFGIGAVRVELVDRLPEVEPGAPLLLGSRIDPSRAPFDLSVPSVLGDPDAVYVSGDVITLLYGSLEHVRLLVTEIDRPALTGEIAKKVALATSNTRLVEIPGASGPGLWIEGPPHVVVLADAPPRLAGNTLVWVLSGRTLRIEGAAGLGDARRIAESMR